MLISKFLNAVEICACVDRDDDLYTNDGKLLAQRCVATKRTVKGSLVVNLGP